MIKVLPGFDERVVAVAAEGQLTRQDYEQVLIPRVTALLKRFDKLRIYYELGTQLTGVDAGAAWEDFKLGVEHLTRWERMAVVSDVHWIRVALEAFRFVMPGRLRIFDSAHATEAREWIQADLRPLS